MWSFIVLISLAVVASESCISNQQVAGVFRVNFDHFASKLFQEVAPHAKFTLTLSPLTIWVTLAAIAEGSDPSTQREMFKVLKLPENVCSRQKLYRIATTRLSLANQVGILHTKALLLDRDAQINSNWYSLVRRQSLLDVISGPVRSDPGAATELIKQILSLKNHQPNIQGNSMLLSSMDYRGLWTNAFSSSVIKRAPFYSYTGQRVGTVDLMTITRKVRIGYVPSMNSKVIELPVGTHGEYRFLFALAVNNDPSVIPVVNALKNDTIPEVLASLQESKTPITIAIPRFVISSELDLKPMLQSIGIKNLWRDPKATRYISTPSAQPSGFIHRATMSLDTKGTRPPPVEYPSNFGSLPNKDRYWSEFVADRPFIFGLFDAETYTCAMATFFSKPTYPY